MPPSSSELDQWLPHRPPMRLVEAVLRHGVEEVVCRARIALDSPLASDGRAPIVLALEMGAQAAALLADERRDAQASSRRGYLVAIRQARFRATSLEAGRALVAVAQRDGAAGGLLRARIRVALEEAPSRLLAEATLSLMRES